MRKESKVITMATPVPRNYSDLVDRGPALTPGGAVLLDSTAALLGALTLGTTAYAAGAEALGHASLRAIAGGIGAAAGGGLAVGLLTHALVSAPQRKAQKRALHAQRTANQIAKRKIINRKGNLITPEGYLRIPDRPRIRIGTRALGTLAAGPTIGASAIIANTYSAARQKKNLDRYIHQVRRL